MSKLSYGVTCCVALAALLAFATPAHAANDAPPGNEEPFTERKDLREERAGISADHEMLDAEREKLKMQCMDVKGQDRTACDAAWDKLRAQRQALAERVKALHEKMRAERRAKAAEKDAAPESIELPGSAGK